VGSHVATMMVCLPSSPPAKVMEMVCAPFELSISHDCCATSPIGKHASPSIWPWPTALPCSLPSENVQYGIAPWSDGRPPLVIWK